MINGHFLLHNKIPTPTPPPPQGGRVREGVIIAHCSFFNDPYETISWI